MALAIKKVTLWRTEVENKPGAVSSVLAPLAESGADLQVMLGYRYPGDKHKATIEVGPVAGKKSSALARKAGLAATAITTLLIQGDDRPGLGNAITQAIAEAGIDVLFLLVQAFDGRFSAVMGFADEAASKLAAAAIKNTVKKIEKQFLASAPSAEAVDEAPMRPSRILVLCRKKCDATLKSFCSDNLPSE